MTVGLGRVGVWVSSRVLNDPSVDAPAAAAEVERLGFGALWIGSAPGDLGLVADLLGATSRLVVATGIVNIWTAPAAATAAAFDRVARAYPDRLLLGIGAGHQGPVEATGQRYTRPVAKLAAYLDELDAADPPVPRDRRVLAALGPKVLGLARDRAAGAHPYLTTPEHTGQARAILGAGPLLAVEQMVVVQTDPGRARTIARANLARYLALPNYTNNWLRLGFTADDLAEGGSDRLVDALIAWGDPGAALSRVDGHLRAGADHVCVQVLTGDPGFPSAALQALAQVLIG